MVWELVADGIGKADGIMERAGGLFYGDDTGSVPEIHWLFLVYPGLVERIVVAGILFLFGYLEYHFAKPGGSVGGGYGYLFVGKREKYPTGNLVGNLRHCRRGLGITEKCDPSGPQGNIVIPVYVGGTLLDELVVTAQARQNLRSGGR